MNADGSGDTRLTNDPAIDQQPSFSLDGRQIVFVRHSPSMGAEIYIMSADGAEETQLTNNDADDIFPMFSPAGDEILFWSDRDGDAALFIMNIDGTEQRRLTYEVQVYISFAGYLFDWR